MTKRRSPAEIVTELRRADGLLAAGRSVREVSAALDISEATFHRWRAQYGGLKAADALRLAELERENRDLKSIVANQCLDILMFRQLTRERLPTPELQHEAVSLLRQGFGVSERRACQVVGLPRSSSRRASATPVPAARAPAAPAPAALASAALAGPPLAAAARAAPSMRSISSMAVHPLSP